MLRVNCTKPTARFFPQIPRMTADNIPELICVYLRNLREPCIYVISTGKSPTTSYDCFWNSLGEHPANSLKVRMKCDWSV